MQDWTEKLIELQNLDLVIAKMGETLAQIPVKIAEAEKLYAAEVSALQLARKEMLLAEQQCARLEAETTATRNKKRDFQQKTTLIKKNDEYKAALEQLAQFDVTVAKLEEEQLQWMEKADAARQDMMAKFSSFNLAQKRAASVKDDLKKLDENCRTRRERLLKQRPDVAKNVEAKLLRKYELLRSNRNFSRVQPCVVPIISEACGRCHMKVTPQEAQETLKGEVVTCQQCGAILYAE